MDALWVDRNFLDIQTFCVESQMGGVSDPISLVLALSLLCELRKYVGMPPYLAFLDLKWGFDVASPSGMLVNTFIAGVHGREWLWIDDVVQSDRQTLELHGILSLPFVLACGTEQGRRFSVPIFNALLKDLKDLLVDAAVGGARATPPEWAREALLEANRHAAASSLDDLPSDGNVLQAFANVVKAACGSLVQTGRASGETASSVGLALSSLPRLSDRLAVVELLGDRPFDPPPVHRRCNRCLRLRRFRSGCFGPKFGISDGEVCPQVQSRLQLRHGQIVLYDCLPQSVFPRDPCYGLRRM